MVGDQYLYSAAKGTSRRLAVGSDPAEWVATDSEKGGIVLSSNGVSLGSANAKYDFLRSYASADTLASGAYFFKVDVPRPADPIALKSMNMQLGSSMSLNLNGLASVLDQYENVYVIYQPEGGEPVKVTQYFESTSSDGTLRYNFAYEGLTILDVNKTIYYTIYGTFNGKQYQSETKSTSLLKYCLSCLNSYNQATVPCANLLEYAMAAEAYAKESRPETDETGFLVNVLTEDQMAKVKQYAYADSAFQAQSKSVVTNNSDPIKFSSQALNMLSRITMLYKVKITGTLDTSKVTFKVTYTDVYGNPACKDYAFDDLEYEVSTGSYVLSFSEFHATQMREMAKCTIYIDGVEHASYDNSIENYCNGAVNKTNNLSEKEKHLARRISLYGDACEAAFSD